MNLLLLLLAGTGGLGTVQTNLVNNWIGPAFLIVVAGFAIKFLISRQFRELAGFLGIAAIVALLVFNAGDLFGETGIFRKIAHGFSTLIGNDSGGSGRSGGDGMIDIFRNFRTFM